MSRSYLYGRDTKTLTAQEYALEKLYDQVDREGYRLTPQQFFKSPEYGQWLDRNFGTLIDQAPPGSQIIRQDPFKLEYRDAEGYTHTLTRGAGSGAELGQVTRQTNRPNILPNQRQNEMLDFLQQRVRQGLTGAPTLADLDPETAAQLRAITEARRAEINKQIEDERGRLVARLYGNRVNQSSIADEAGARFAEGAGRLQQQEAGDNAQRLLALRQYLTDAIRQQGEQAGSLYANLSGQSNQRDIAAGGLDVELRRLIEASRQFNAGNYLNQQQLAQEQQKIDSMDSPLNKVLKISQIVANLASGAGGGLSAYNALAGPKTGAAANEANIRPRYFPSSYPWP